MSLKRVLIVPDAHVPYHDKRAWSLLLKVGHALRFEWVVCLGDLLDNYAVSDYEKTDNRKNDLEWEVKEAAAAAKELERLAPRRIFCEGNHEFRFRRYLATKAPEAKRLLESLGATTPGMLGLGSRWQFVPYRQSVQVGKLWVSHDFEYSGLNAVSQVLASVGSNAAFGHTHRMGAAYGGHSATGQRHVAASYGWLGDVDQIDYKHRLKAKKEWQLGFGVAYLDSKLNAHCVPVPIIGYSCVVEGKLFTLSNVEKAA